MTEPLRSWTLDEAPSLTGVRTDSDDPRGPTDDRRGRTDDRRSTSGDRHDPPDNPRRRRARD